MGRRTLVGSGNALGKVGTDMGLATPDGKMLDWIMKMAHMQRG